MKNKNHIAYFIGEEGYGHATRSCSIIINIIEIIGANNVHIDIFCGKHHAFLKRRLHSISDIVRLHRVDSNILLVKDDGHNLNREKSIKRAIQWRDSLEEWKNLVREILIDCSMIISDSVPQATYFASYFRCPSINISHFTWDWMYDAISRVSSLTDKSDITSLAESLDIMTNMYDKFDLSIFPPLTPNDNIELYKLRNRRVEYCSYILSDSFIETSFSENKNIEDSVHEKVLIMNNGTRSLTRLINSFIQNWPKNGKTKLIVGFCELNSTSRSFIKNNSNISLLPRIEVTHRFIGEADIIVARAGYNTLSELIHSNTLAVLVDENNNPEIASNLEFAKSKSYYISQVDNISIETIQQILATKNPVEVKNTRDNARSNLLLGRNQCADIISKFLLSSIN